MLKLVPLTNGCILPSLISESLLREYQLTRVPIDVPLMRRHIKPCEVPL
jgi:hypothetical protein